MKNLLSENMLRFGTKNLSEAAKRELVLKSIMETINEHGLHNAVKRQLHGINEALTGVPNAKLKGPDAPIVVEGRTFCKSGMEYVKISAPLVNTSMKEAYITAVDVIGQGDYSSDRYGNPNLKVSSFNTVYAGKPYVGQAEKVNYSAVGIAPKTAILNCVLEFNIAQMYGAESRFTGATIMVTYNGGVLEIPVTFEGFTRDETGKVACEVPITLPKGF